MAWTNWGFDGTINEAQWSQMAGFLGSPYAAKDSGSCAVTAVSGARSVSVAAGTLYGDGIVSVSDTAETVAMTTPVNGQWYVIALRRTWATNTVALVAIAGATTSTSTPSAPPTSFPTLNTSQGVLTDQPIAWAWCNSANTTVVVSDLRELPLTNQVDVLQATSATQSSDITAIQAVNTTQDGQITTLQGADVIINTRIDKVGNNIIKPSLVTVSGAGASGSVATYGTTTFDNAASVSLNGVFTSDYTNYRIIVEGLSDSVTDEIRLRLRASGTDATGAQYFDGGYYIATGSGLAAYTAGGTSTLLGFTPSYADSYCGYVIDVVAPAITRWTKTFQRGTGVNSASAAIHTNVSTLHAVASAYDGFTLFCLSGRIAGTVSVYGYNKG